MVLSVEMKQPMFSQFVLVELIERPSAFAMSLQPTLPKSFEFSWLGMVVLRKRS